LYAKYAPTGSGAFGISTFKTITSDNGSEFSKLTEVFEETYYTT